MQWGYNEYRFKTKIEYLTSTDTKYLLKLLIMNYFAQLRYVYLINNN